MNTLTVVSAAWSWNFTGLADCVTLLALYGVLGGFRRSRTLAWFLAGEILFAAVVCSPLDLLARQYLFTAEAMEQLLLALVVPYVLVRGVPERAVRRLRLDRLHVPYQIAWMLGMAVLSMWYVPRLLNRALESEAFRWCEYTTLLLGGGAFWWPLHSPLRQQRIPLVPNSLLYLAAATVWCSIAGLILAFEQPWVSRYVQPPDTLHIAESLVSDWSFTRETDQQTAGLLFWVGAGCVLLSEVVLVYYRWYNSPEVRNEGSPGLTGT